MEKIYEVSFVCKEQHFRDPVEADSKADAIAQAMEIAPGEDFTARLLFVDGVRVNGLWGGVEE